MCSGACSVRRSLMFVLFGGTFIVLAVAQPGHRRSPRAVGILGQHAPGRRAVPRVLRSSIALVALRCRDRARPAVRSSGHRPLAGLVDVPQQQVVRHQRSRSSATTSASTCSSCRSSRSCSTGCSLAVVFITVLVVATHVLSRRDRDAAAATEGAPGHQGPRRRAARPAWPSSRPATTGSPATS